MPIDVHRALNAGRVGGPGLRMGLVRLEPGTWLELHHPDIEHQRAEKERLLALSPERFVVHRPVAVDASAELLAMIEVEIAAAGVDRPAPVAGRHPLDQAGRLVREDLCVHLPVDGRLTLVGGSVCFPTHWSLPDFIGRPLRGLHGAVPHYDPDLADRVDTFLLRLPEGPGVMRRNWSLVGSADLSLPERSRGWPDRAGDELVNSVWLRSERQTLRRLPDTGAVVFTIGIDVEPLRDLATRPADAALFADALADLSPELAGYKGIANVRAELVGWLRAV